MRECRERVGLLLNYYDFKSNREVKVIRSVDIEYECRYQVGRPVFLDFGTTSSGMLVRIVVERYGVRTTLHVKQLDSLTDIRLSLLNEFAWKCGLSLERLIAIIRRECPLPEPNQVAGMGGGSRRPVLSRVTFCPLKSGRYRCNQTGELVSKHLLDGYRRSLLHTGHGNTYSTVHTAKHDKPERHASRYRNKYS